MSNSIHFTLFEKILILAGLLFFANVAYIASGGGWEVLYMAKSAYLFGIVLLLEEFINTKS